MLKSLNFINLFVTIVICLWLPQAVADAPATTNNSRERLSTDVAAGRPIVIHVVVALADNKHQWIAKVPDAIGNGQDSRTNLYWGARYGLKTFLKRDAAWQQLQSPKVEDLRILERLLLYKKFRRGTSDVDVYLLADAWDGRYINDTIDQFMRYNAGLDRVVINSGSIVLESGGGAHLVAYIGHNALMDYAGIRGLMTSSVTPARVNPANEAIVLACKSQPYFSKRLQNLAANPLLLTTGLMAPEAYTLNAAIEKWITGGSVLQVRQAAAASYNHYQKTGRRAAERLFNAR